MLDHRERAERNDFRWKSQEKNSNEKSPQVQQGPIFFKEFLSSNSNQEKDNDSKVGRSMQVVVHNLRQTKNVTRAKGLRVVSSQVQPNRTKMTQNKES